MTLPESDVILSLHRKSECLGGQKLCITTALGPSIVASIVEERGSWGGEKGQDVSVDCGMSDG